MGVPFDAVPMDFTFAAATSHGARQRTMIHCAPLAPFEPQKFKSLDITFDI